MANTISSVPEIRVVGNSWVIQVPEAFSRENNPPKGSQVLLTFKENDTVEAEILPPLSEKLSEISARVLKNRRKVYEELRLIGD